MSEWKKDPHNVNVSVLEARMDQSEKNIESLTVICKELALTTQQIGTAVQLLQQAHSESDKHIDIMRPKVQTLMENRNMLKGGWVALAAIGSVLLLLATAVGALVAVLSYHKGS